MLIIFYFLLPFLVDCGDLPIPSDGMISYTSGTLLGSIATYSCNLGYVLIGDDAVRTCDSNGQWSGNQPTGCQRKQEPAHS